MGLNLSNNDIMIHLWENMKKTSDGQYAIYSNDDIQQLWTLGFVDTARIDRPTWHQAFSTFKQQENIYHVSLEAFLSLDDYRYKGEIFQPFDAMAINEGKYTEQGFNDLIDASIRPSCNLNASAFNQFSADLMADFQDPSDQLILIKKPAKKRFNDLLYKHPSPLRNLEILINSMIDCLGIDIASELDDAESAQIASETARQMSQFSAVPSNIAEKSAHNFQQLQNVKKEALSESISETEKKATSVSLKDIRRMKRGLRG